MNHFVVTDEDQEADSAPPKNPLDISGVILLIDDQEAESKLIEHFLRGTRAELVTATDMTAALAAINSRPIDLVLCDLNLDKQNGEDVIRVILDGGFCGPVIAFTGETNQTRLDTVLAAGARVVFRKPYTAAKLYATLSKWLSIDTGSNGEPIVSTLESEPGMPELIEWYLKQVKIVIHTLERDIKAGSYEDVYRHCRMLKETGLGYGFKVLSETAREALVALDASGSVQESADTLRKLRAVSGRLSLKPAA